MLIGIVGFIGSGKGAVGKILVKDYDFENDSFANPLKDAVSTIFGWDRDLLEGDTDDSRIFREKSDEYWSEVIEREMTPRLALQLFGTECIREVFHPNVWSASLINRYTKSELNTVVTDCRFGNEVQAIKDAGGQIWNIERGEKPKWYEDYYDLMCNDHKHEIERKREMGIFPHVSETDWIGSEFDYIIENNGTLRDLQVSVDTIMNPADDTMEDVLDLHKGY